MRDEGSTADGEEQEGEGARGEGGGRGRHLSQEEFPWNPCGEETEREKEREKKRTV